MTSFLDRQLTSQPLHLPRNRGVWVTGVGCCVSERQSDRCQARWDLWEASVKQSITFETAIWLTAAPITQSSFLKLHRAWAWEGVRERERQRGKGGRRGRRGEGGREEEIWSSRSSAVQSPWSPPQLSSSWKPGRQRAGREKEEEEEEPRDPHLKKYSLACPTPPLPPLCSLHTEIQSKPPLCMVLKLDYEGS